MDIAKKPEILSSQIYTTHRSLEPKGFLLSSGCHRQGTGLARRRGDCRRAVRGALEGRYRLRARYWRRRDRFGGAGTDRRVSELAIEHVDDVAVISNGSLGDPENVRTALAETSGLITLGTRALANHDRPNRVRAGEPLADLDPSIVFQSDTSLSDAEISGDDYTGPLSDTGTHGINPVSHPTRAAELSRPASLPCRDRSGTAAGRRTRRRRRPLTGTASPRTAAARRLPLR